MILAGTLMPLKRASSVNSGTPSARKESSVAIGWSIPRLTTCRRRLVMIPERIIRVVASRARELVAQDGLARNVEPLQRNHRAEVRGVDFLPDAVALARTSAVITPYAA